MNRKWVILFALTFLATEIVISADKPEDRAARLKRIEQDKKEAESMTPKEIAEEDRKRTEASVAKYLRFDKDDTIELLKIERRLLDDMKPNEELFHKYRVLQRVLIVNERDRTSLMDSIKNSIHWSRLLQALCFDPGYGVRITHGKQTTDLLICYHCNQVHVYRNNEFATSLTILDVDDGEVAAVLIKAANSKP